MWAGKFAGGLQSDCPTLDRIVSRSTNAALILVGAVCRRGRDPTPWLSLSDIECASSKKSYDRVAYFRYRLMASSRM